MSIRNEPFPHIYDIFCDSSTLQLISLLLDLSSLRVAEHVWGQGPLISEYPAEALTIKNLDDSMALLASEDGQERFETKVRSWMKNITDLLQEGEQLRLETDEQGPQDEIEFWKAKAAHLTLVVDEMMAPPTKMTLVTLRAAKCKLLKACYMKLKYL